MEIKSIFYKQYINTQAYQIPVAAIEELIDEFAINAKFYMASDIDADTTAKINNAVVELLKNRFRYVPLKLIGEAYTRGSLGELGGTTRFTIRNVYIWLSQIEEKNQRLFLEEQSKKEDEKRRSEARAFKDLRQNSQLYGKAFYWKISHCPMPDREYDRLTLDKIVEMLRKGYKSTELHPQMIL